MQFEDYDEPDMFGLGNLFGIATEWGEAPRGIQIIRPIRGKHAKRKPAPKWMARKNWREIARGEAANRRERIADLYWKGEHSIATIAHILDMDEENIHSVIKRMENKSTPKGTFATPSVRVIGVREKKSAKATTSYFEEKDTTIQ